MTKRSTVDKIVKPNSLIGVDYSYSGEATDLLEFYGNRDKMLATFSEGELKTFNFIGGLLQKDHEGYNQDTKKTIYAAYPMVIREKDLKDFLGITKRHFITLEELKEEEALGAEEGRTKSVLKKTIEILKNFYSVSDPNEIKISITDRYLAGLVTKGILAQDFIDPISKHKIKTRAFSIVNSFDKIKVGRENIYLVEPNKHIANVFKNIERLTEKDGGAGNYSKITTHKTKGKYLQLLEEFLNKHKWKGEYEAKLPEMLKALNLPTYEVVNGGKRRPKLLDSVPFEFSTYKKEEKVYFKFLETTLF